MRQLAYEFPSLPFYFQGRLEQSKIQTQELMAKTTELRNEGAKLALQKELSEKMRERLTLTNKVKIALKLRRQPKKVCLGASSTFPAQKSKKKNELQGVKICLKQKTALFNQ